MDFRDSEIKAYLVTNVVGEGKIVLKKATTVKHDTGILFIGKEGTYAIPLADSYADSVSMLTGSSERDFVLEEGTEAYCLCCPKSDHRNVRFLRLEPGTVCKRGKAMLATSGKRQ